MTRRNICISIFVIIWLLLFTYQTFRVNHLNPLIQRTFGITLPRVPLLFPPAGWIMFFNINPSYGFAEIYGIKDDRPVKLNPHDIFETRAIGYDNIHRNVMIGVLYPDRANPFCRYIRRKFPLYDTFAVVYGQYPDIIHMPDRFERQVVYRCQ